MTFYLQALFYNAYTLFQICFLVMGITGLLKFVKDATEPIHIKKYAGKTVAVDTYCWIHRGSFACAEKLAKKENTDQYVKYCLKFIDMLQSFSVKPILVFDGCRLPSKELVEQERHRRRKENLERGRQFLREGKLSAARDCFTKCISVTPAMALKVIEAARARGVDCIVAPYEADAQLAYLVKTSIAQAVVTEDSDLLCFGCKNVIFKMDLTGRAQEVSIENFGRVNNIRGFTPELFRHMCILSGCDYLPSIKGVGLVKACKALKLSKSKDSYQIATRLHQYIKGLSPVDPNYGAEFIRADKTFLYQLVFDSRQRKLRPLNDYPSSVNAGDLDFAGPYVSDEKAFQIALGNIDVNTQLVISYFDVNAWLKTRKPMDNFPSIWEVETNRLSPTTVNQTSDKKIPNHEKNNISSTNQPHNLINNLHLNKKSPKTQPSLSSTSKGSPCNNNSDNSIKDLLKLYEPSKTEAQKSVKSSKVVKSRFFVSQISTPNRPNDYNVDEAAANTSSSLFSDQKSVEDSVLDDILTELTEQARKSPDQQGNSPVRDNSSAKRKKACLSSGDSFDQFSARKRKRLNLHFLPNDASLQRNREDAENEVLNDEIIPILDDGDSPRKPFSPLPESNLLSVDDECDEVIPVLDLNEPPSRPPLCEISNTNNDYLSQVSNCSSQGNDCLSQVNDSSPKHSHQQLYKGPVKTEHRRLGLPSRGQFNNSPVKLKLSKYFSGSKPSGLRKVSKKSRTNHQPSIRSFFMPS